MARTVSAAVLLALYASTAYSINWTDCGSKDATLQGVSVTGCENTDRCILKKGTEVSISIRFQSHVVSQTATVAVHGVIAEVPLPFPLNNTNACTSTGMHCPLSSGTTYNYQNTFLILNSFPSISLDVKWEIRDDQGNDLICTLFPVQIAS